MTVPYTFGTATTSIPLSNLDANFNTPITLGNTSIYLGNTTTTIGNLTLTNATISSGTVNITNVTVTTANVTNITVSGTTTLSGLTASTALALDASKNVVSVTNTGTGNNVLSASPTLTGTIAGASLSLSSLTISRVTFAGASGLLSDSANLTWDNNTLNIVSPSNSPINLSASSTSNTLIQLTNANAAKDLISRFRQNAGGGNWWDLTMEGSTNDFTFDYNDGEKVRITNAGNVGIGTSSPQSQLHIYNASSATARLQGNQGVDGQVGVLNFANRLDITGGYIIGSLSVNRTGDDNSGAMLFSTANGASTPTERMRIDSSGNVGIGTNGPSVKLHVSGTGAVSSRTYATDATGDASFFVGNNDSKLAGPLVYGSTKTAYGALGSNETAFYSNVSTTIMADGASQVIKFAAGGNTERMRLDSSGNLLVGTTSAYGGSKIMSVAETNTNNLLVLQDTGTSYSTSNFYALFLNSAQNAAGSIAHTGATTVAFQTTSDKRLKENIIDAPSALNSLTSIKVRSFDWIEDKTHVTYGFIAQEINEHAPEIVAIGDSESTITNPKGTWGVEYGRLTPMLVKAIQEQQALIESLTTRLTALENK